MRRLYGFLLVIVLPLTYQNCGELSSVDQFQYEQSESGGAIDSSHEENPQTSHQSGKLFSAAGSYCHLTKLGEVYCWPNLDEFKVLVKVNIDLPVVEVYMSYDKLVFRDSQGGFHCINKKRPELTPESLQTPEDCPFVFEGQVTSFGSFELSSDVYCYQNSSKDVFCNGTKVTNLSGQEFKQFSMRSSYACGLETEGDVYCWSMAGSVTPIVNELLNGADSFVATKLLLPEKVLQMTASYRGNCFLLDTKEVSCWGTVSEVGIFNTLENNPHLESYVDGNEGTDYYSPPIKMPNLQNVKEIYSSPLGHTCALNESGVLSCWGKSVYSSNIGHLEFDNGSAFEHYYPITEAHPPYQGMETVRFSFGSMCGLKDENIICDGVLIAHE